MDAVHREKPATIHRDRGTTVAGRSASTPSGSKVKRRTWSFINVSTCHDARAPLSKRRREQDSLVAPKNTLDNRRYHSPASGPSSAPQTRVSSPEPQPRPRSSRGPSSSKLLQVPNFSKTLALRSGTGGLPTISESKVKTASMESLRCCVDGGKVKRWEGSTRTTSSWNGIRKVSSAIPTRESGI